MAILLFSAKFRLNFCAPQDFAYLNQSNELRDDSSTDRQRFLFWKTALTTLGIPFSDVMRLLAAILLLGNVKFEDVSEAGDLDLKGQRG